MTLRKYRLDEAAEATKRVAHLRRPQREAFEIVHALVSNLSDDLPKLTHARLEEEYRELGYPTPFPIHFQIELATGVGKTRLMGSIALYLFNARQTRNILIVVPRVAILEKLERETNPGSPKYLFVDPSLAPRINVCTRGNIEAFNPTPTGLNVFLLSPQTLTSEAGRFAKPDEYRGYSLREYLRDCADLVVFADEAHHLRAAEGAAWSAALRDLRPKLWLGFTATAEAGSGELLYRYDLATCLREGLYTKSVRIWVEKKPEEMEDDEWDRLTIDFALKRLARKKGAIGVLRSREPSFPAIEPVLLICARDTAHADNVARMLQDRFELTEDQILVSHSDRAKSEEDVTRLVAIDSPGNQIRVVVNVFQLTEGWDVNNVYVIAPLRAMATFVGAVQSMGRGLRLPAGKRTMDPDVDSLDIVCFGRATLGAIVREATETFGEGEPGEGNPVDVAPPTDIASEPPVADSRIEIKPTEQRKLSIPRLERVIAIPSLDFEIEARKMLEQGGVEGVDLEDFTTSTSDDTVSLTFDSVVGSAAMGVLSKCKYLDPIGDGPAMTRLVQRFLSGLGASPGSTVNLDPVRLAVFLAGEINKRYMAQVPSYQRTNAMAEIDFGTFLWPVPVGKEALAPRVPVSEWTKALYRLPIGGWSKSVYQGAAFETGGEYKVATILDADRDVLWWLRNDPAKLRIPTPVGYLEPDFVVASGTRERVKRITILEIKGGTFWDGPGSVPRLKASAAVNWAKIVGAIGQGPPWDTAVVLDEDTEQAASFGQILKLSVA